jgi:hypothetical protein
MPRKTKSNLRVWLGGLVFVTLLAGFVAFVEWPRPPENNSSLESWLHSYGYSAMLPFRNNIPPGMVLRIEMPGQSIAATADMVGLNDSEAANAPDMSWTMRSRLDAFGDANMFPMVADARGVGASAVKVSIDHVRIREIPYVQLSDAARSNTTLLRLTKDHDPKLVLVNKVLEAGTVRCEFFGRDNAKIDLRTSGRGALKTSEDFQFAADGSLESAVPLVIGYHAEALSTQALSLGEQPIIGVRLKTLNVEDTAALGDSGGRPQSDYRLFVLTMGLGNYGKAALPGARDAALQVVSRLLPFVRSKGGAVMSFISPPDTNRALITKEVILKEIRAFAEKNKSTVDDPKSTFIIFYYVGHGLSEGIRQGVFIQPESYTLKAGESVMDSANRLVDVGEVVDALRPLSGNIIILMDACRQHNHEDQQLVRAWGALGQNQDNMQSILNALQFTSETLGPSIVLFGSPSGEDADVVPVAWSNDSVGRLAAQLDVLFNDIEQRGLALSPRDFVDRMQIATASSSLGNVVEVRGYTALRDDFKAALPQGVLFKLAQSHQ